MSEMETIEGLDPGIADVVQRLREAGFETTDSGDGVSKPNMECAMPFPHVAARLRILGDCDWLADEAHRMRAVCGEGWEVQLSYSTSDGSWLLFASQESQP